jgi:hypothetical protein
LQEIRDSQGGNIRVKSVLQKGSTFTFTLPIFSLTPLLALLLHHDKWPAESVALVVVEIRVLEAWPSMKFQEEWSRKACGLLQRCILPDLDVLLPKMNVGEKGEQSFIAAFVDDKGASILANRIREQFGRLPSLTQAGVTLSVSFSMVSTVLERYQCIHGRSGGQYGHTAGRVGQIQHH